MQIMDAREYLKSNGRAHCKLVAEQAGTTLAYFEQIAYGFRRPSVSLAKRLDEASKGALHAQQLVFAPLRSHNE